MRVLPILAIFVFVTTFSHCGSGSSAQATSVSDKKALSTAPQSYSPLSVSKASRGVISNQEAVIPAQCYTKTEGQFNPCWVCHTGETPRNHKGDWPLQAAYAFSDLGLTNHWENLFKDFSTISSRMSDDEMLSYIRQDNYTPFREAMLLEYDYAGWLPDIDLHAGFDPEGFAVDGSWWRSFRYKPFLGTFWPTNGATDDIMIRLPKTFYTNSKGHISKEIYKINLAIVEAAMTSGGKLTDPVKRDVEALDETLINRDLNSDGKISNNVTQIIGLPKFYVGAAQAITVRKNLYPKFTEFLHTVRYLDPDASNWLSQRVKEVRYSQKTKDTDQWALSHYYEEEADNKDEEKLPIFQGSGAHGMLNEIGWKLQGFIEDKKGRMRAQTDQEQYLCMGCHSNIGVTADQTFGFPRKVPGAHGWGEVNIAGIPDVPQAGHTQPEIMTYLERNGGGDEYRNNAEMITRFFDQGNLKRDEVARAAPGGDLDIRHLILPSKQRAYDLNKAYMALVREQRFDLGRDPMLTPPKNVHRKITEVSAGFTQDKIYRDGTIWLDWSGTKFVRQQKSRTAD